jgi:hypothetical protein
VARVVEAGSCPLLGPCAVLGHAESCVRAIDKAEERGRVLYHSIFCMREP